MALIAGCGGGSTTAAVVLLPAKIPLVSTDVAGKTFYSTSIIPTVTPIISSVTYTFNADNTVGTSTDTWLISSDGAITLTDIAGNIKHKFYCIQKEAAYWLFYDYSNNNTITRFYFDAAAAQTYLASIAVASGGVKLGGSVQGVPLSSTFSSSTFSNVTTVAGNVGTVPLIPVDGRSTAATFNQPTGITTDGTNLYVADYKNNMIRKIAKSTFSNYSVSRLAGSPTALAGLANSSDGTGDTATFNLPSALTTDGTSLYVADTGNNAIRRVDMATGTVTLISGSTTGLAGTVDSLNGTDARFNQPTGITTDGTNLYVADYGNQIIRKIVISSGAVATIAGAAGSIGSTDSTDSTGVTARFSSPARIATDGTNLYVTDLGNRTIRMITIATGNTVTIAGTAGTAPGTDDANADGLSARFNQPNGITTDGTSLFVTDSYNNTIRSISLTAPYHVTKISGVTYVDASSPGHVNSADGIASFYTPIGITTDGISLFVADSKNNLIRKLSK